MKDDWLCQKELCESDWGLNYDYTEIKKKLAYAESNKDITFTTTSHEMDTPRIIQSLVYCGEV